MRTPRTGRTSARPEDPGSGCACSAALVTPSTSHPTTPRRTVPTPDDGRSRRTTRGNPGTPSTVRPRSRSAPTPACSVWLRVEPEHGAVEREQRQGHAPGIGSERSIRRRGAPRGDRQSSGAVQPGFPSQRSSLEGLQSTERPRRPGGARGGASGESSASRRSQVRTGTIVRWSVTHQRGGSLHPQPISIRRRLLHCCPQPGERAKAGLTDRAKRDVRSEAAGEPFTRGVAAPRARLPLRSLRPSGTPSSQRAERGRRPPLVGRARHDPTALRGAWCDRPVRHEVAPRRLDRRGCRASARRSPRRSRDWHGEPSRARDNVAHSGGGVGQGVIRDDAGGA